MLTVGITGGIGSGKSTICRIFGNLKIPSYDSDRELKTLYRTNVKLKKELADNISPEIINRNGEINLVVFAQLIFSNSRLLEKTNRLVHPYVQEHFQKWKESHQANNPPYVLFESAILFESGFFTNCDFVILVTANEKTRFKRVKDRDKRSTKEIKDIMSRQWQDDQKGLLSDYTFINENKTLEQLQSEIIELHNRFIGVNNLFNENQTVV